jgi:hypothetical protein
VKSSSDFNIDKSEKQTQSVSLPHVKMEKAKSRDTGVVAITDSVTKVLMIVIYLSCGYT